MRNNHLIPKKVQSVADDAKNKIDESKSKVEETGLVTIGENYEIWEYVGLLVKNYPKKAEELTQEQKASLDKTLKKGYASKFKGDIYLSLRSYKATNKNGDKIGDVFDIYPTFEHFKEEKSVAKILIKEDMDKKIAEELAKMARTLGTRGTLFKFEGTMVKDVKLTLLEVAYASKPEKKKFLKYLPVFTPTKLKYQPLY